MFLHVCMWLRKYASKSGVWHKMAGMCKHPWHTQGKEKEEWMEVKIGCPFAFILTKDLQIDSTLAIGLIITLPTPGPLTILNLLLGLPDFTGKHKVLTYSIYIDIDTCNISLLLSSFGVFMKCLSFVAFVGYQI